MSSQITPQQRADAEDKAQRTAAFQKQSESDLAGRLSSGATGGNIPKIWYWNSNLRYWKSQ
jgi:hypothetical protein